MTKVPPVLECAQGDEFEFRHNVGGRLLVAYVQHVRSCITRESQLKRPNTEHKFFVYNLIRNVQTNRIPKIKTANLEFGTQC